MMKKTARTPSSEAAKRVAAIFHRQLTTKWSEKEIKKFRALVKDGMFTDFNNLSLIERCYLRQWPPNRDKNILRHDLMTFLNHFETELDRAVAWNELHPVHQPRKIIPLPPAKEFTAEPLSDQELEQVQRFREQFKLTKGRDLSLPMSAFQQVKNIMEAE